VEIDELSEKSQKLKLHGIEVNIREIFRRMLEASVSGMQTIIESSTSYVSFFELQFLSPF
jgi:hypothetical protein